MPLETTVIGSYPKPDYLPAPDWFRKYKGTGALVEEANEYLANRATHQGIEELETKALQEVIDEQTELGIDVITDGEILRENYIFHFCRKLDGFDFESFKVASFRNGACSQAAPTITGLVKMKTAHINDTVDDWKKAQSMSQVPVKVTIPGPMTIIGTTINEYYKDLKELSAALADIINAQLLLLAAAGCRYVQVDEPLLVRSPTIAEQYGITHLTRCFHGVGPDVFKAVHACCGYPDYLDQEDYSKADRSIYMKLAPLLDECGFDAVSLEDAHQHNDLSLLGHFRKTAVIFGCVAIACSRVESVAEIGQRVTHALAHLPATSRLILAPDCGLGYLPTTILRQKLTNMVAVARSLP